MITKQEQLLNRGYLTNGSESKFLGISFEEKTTLLKSNKATERTLGARLLQNSKTTRTVAVLIDALRVEKKLYPKLEICSTLALIGVLAVAPLIECLGKIGSNQHTVVPKKEFLKDSYPLPRDIASRTLIRIGEPAMPALLKELGTESTKTLSELIDAIGHINYNSPLEATYESLIACYDKNKTNNLIRFKIIRAFSGVAESKAFLNKLQAELDDVRLRQEVARSLRLIGFKKEV